MTLWIDSKCRLALIKFDISGAGFITAVDNGNIASHEMYKASQRHAYRGVCIALVKANQPFGKVIVKATADGLTGSAVSLEVK